MKSIYENYYYTLKLKDYEKRSIRRIYFDIIENMNISTMQCYTAKDWIIINSMTTMLRRELNIEEPGKLIGRCNCVCKILRLALNNPAFSTDRKTKEEFWLCMVELFNNTYFDLFWNDGNDENTYFTELVNSLYLNILTCADAEDQNPVFASLVIVLFHIYKLCLDNKMEIFTLVFPEPTIEKIKNVKNSKNMCIGKFLLDLVDYKKKLMENP